MVTDPPALRTTDTVGRAVDLLLQHRVLALPVIDDAERYQGTFAKSRLFSLLLPTVVAIEQMLPKMAQLPDLSFLSDDLGQMQERLRDIAGNAVGPYADRTVPVLHPESPMMAAVLLLFRTRNFVPVVDPDSGRLLGVVSTWDTIARLREGA